MSKRPRNNNSPNPKRARSSNDTDYDVVIIGAGFAGAQAAATLHAAGLSVMVYEYNDRFGGRCWSNQFKTTAKDSQGKDQTVNWWHDMGAEYIGYAQSAIWVYSTSIYPEIGASLVDNYGISYRRRALREVEILANRPYRYSDEDAWLGIGGIPPLQNAKAQGAAGLKPYDGVFDFIGDIIPLTVFIGSMSLLQVAIDTDDINKTPFVEDLDKMTIMDWADNMHWYLSPPTHDLIRISSRAVISAEPDVVSLLWFFWYCKLNGGYLEEVNDTRDGPQQYFSNYGFEHLAANIAKPVSDAQKVQMKKKVTDVTYSSDSSATVTVADRDGSNPTNVTAKKVIVAMSPHDAGKNINLPKPVWDKFGPFMNEPMGKTMKAFAYYTTPWWANIKDKTGAGFSGYVGGTEPVPGADPTDPVCICWCMDNTHFMPKFAPDGTPLPVVKPDDEVGPFFPLMLFVVGQEITKLEKLQKLYDEEYVKKKLLCQVAALFGVDKNSALYAVVQNPSTFFNFTWTDPPSSQLPPPPCTQDVPMIIHGGPVTVCRPGVITKVQPNFRKPVGPIHMAGTEFASITPGYMNGAIVNGAETAQQICEELGVECPPLPYGCTPAENPMIEEWLVMPEKWKNAPAEFAMIWELNKNKEKKYNYNTIDSDPSAQYNPDQCNGVLKYLVDLLSNDAYMSYVMWQMTDPTGTPTDMQTGEPMTKKEQAEKFTSDVVFAATDFIEYKFNIDPEIAVRCEWIGNLVQDNHFPLPVAIAIFPLQILCYCLKQNNMADSFDGLMIFCKNISKWIYDESTRSKWSPATWPTMEFLLGTINCIMLTMTNTKPTPPDCMCAPPGNNKAKKPAVATEEPKSRFGAFFNRLLGHVGQRKLRGRKPQQYKK